MNYVSDALAHTHLYLIYFSFFFIITINIRKMNYKITSFLVFMIILLILIMPLKKSYFGSGPEIFDPNNPKNLKNCQ